MSRLRTRMTADGGDAGFTLVELAVAASLFMVLNLFILGIGIRVIFTAVEMSHERLRASGTDSNTGGRGTNADPHL